MLKRKNTLPTKTSIFISSATKAESVQEFETKSFEQVLYHDLHCIIKIICLHVVAFNKHFPYFAFLR